MALFIKLCQMHTLKIYAVFPEPDFDTIVEFLLEICRSVVF